jgi:D-alanyl-D-alanine carboxypeptidase
MSNMNTSYFKSNKIPLLILGATSSLFSRLMFLLFNDPEGPNLLIVTGMAVIVFLLSLAVYFFSAPTTSLKKLLLVILIPMVITAGFYFWFNKPHLNGGDAQVPLDQNAQAKLDQLFDRLLEKNKGMGSLVLAKDGKVIYSRSFGYGQITENDKKLLDADTKYRISSITKMYTAVMIFQLVEEGKLKLTDTLDKFFPQIPNASRITIAQMLSHRSGIPDLQVEEGWYLQPRTQDEIVATIAKGQPQFEPDTKTAYSNTGYNLLGYIVEKIDGKSYADALKDRITSKIGLKDTYVGTGQSDPEKNEAIAYKYIGNWIEGNEPDLSIPGGGGSIMSTPADMAIFIKALFDLKLVSQDSLNQMMTERDGEGMGIHSFTFADRTLYGETGGSGSSGAWLNYFPEEKLALAYTTNVKIYPVNEIISGVFDIYWNRPFEIPTFEAFAVSPDVLERYVGTYSAAGAPMKITIIRDGATLYLKTGNEQADGIPLEATAENKFTIGPGTAFEFDAEKGLLTFTRGGVEMVLTKEK